MDPDGVPISDWLHAGTSDPQAVADRYDEWAKSYDDDLASWSYQAPAVVQPVADRDVVGHHRASVSRVVAPEGVYRST